MFGMGTGGSLRLLSPETKLSLDAIAAAFSLSDASAIELPRVFLLSTFTIAWRFRAFRTLKTAQVRAYLPSDHDFRFALLTKLPNSGFLDQALDRLVSSSSIRCRTSTDDLSTLSSSRGLTCSKQWQFSSPGGLHA